MIEVRSYWRECGCNGTHVLRDGVSLSLKGSTCPECLKAADAGADNPRWAQLTLFPTQEGLTDGERSG